MPGYRILISPAPPAGFRWQLLKQYKVVVSGTAKTENDARTAAEKARALDEGQVWTKDRKK